MYLSFGGVEIAFSHLGEGHIIVEDDICESSTRIDAFKIGLDDEFKVDFDSEDIVSAGELLVADDTA